MPTPSHIPARVVADAAEADATLASLAAAANTDTIEPVPAEPAPAPAPAALEPAPSAPTVQPVDTAALAEKIRQLEQAQLTTLGRLNQATQQNAQLQAQLARASEPAPAPAPPAPAPAPAITDKDREEYGDDLIGLIGRVIDQHIGSRVEDLSSKVAGLEGRIGRIDTNVQSVRQSTQQTAFQRYEADLTQLCPDWVQINDEPALLDWLENVDTLSGKKYADLLADAHQKMDATRVAHIFNLYKSGGSTSAQPAAGTQSDTQGTPAPAIDPISLAAPDTSPAAPAPANPPAGKIWTQAEVDKLYDDKQKKRITPQVFQQREQEYLLALAEGRVAAA